CVGAHPSRGALRRFAVDDPVTPTLDAVVASGTSFRQCFSAAPYTTASHASILTGAMPARHGVREYYRTGLSSAVSTLFELFKRRGYTTVLATDFPVLLGPILGFSRSVDHYLVEDDAAVGTLLASLSGPVFCFWHFGGVHNPFGLTSPAVDGPVFEAEVERVAALAGIPEQTETELEWLDKERGVRERLLRQRYIRATDTMYAHGRYDELMQLFVGGVGRFDARRFADAIATLERVGWWRDATMAVVADHGEEYSERAFAHFNGLWDGIVQVPFILRGPDVEPGRAIDWVCRTIDVAPTLLELAGVELAPEESAALDGTSLVGALAHGRDPALVATGESTFGFADRIRDFMHACARAKGLLTAPVLSHTRLDYVRTARWKALARTDLTTGYRSWSLYDVSVDPTEASDLAGHLPEVVRGLAGTLNEAPAAPPGADIALGSREAAALAEALSDMGYRPGREWS
ncbi:MAG TPA: sulfatase-like hydrolase/transferase, partial [Kofleriaceae bacterium]|nr:sulfatase-like hydrolase/transferase [Kofleriaceae bacterium]